MIASTRIPSQLLSPTAVSLLLCISIVAYVGCQPDSATEAVTDTQPHVRASTAVDAGRYLIILGGCNDCHTPGYMEAEVPETDWLTGAPVGFRGPWGTTYPPNLRLRVQEITEDEWVAILHTRTQAPPMPWINTNKMAEQDVRAMYQYIKSLGSKGESMPVAVPPGQEPATPYISLEPQNMESAQ